MLTQISTRGMSRDDWLALRRGSLGGSDAAAVIGMSEWSTPYSVWLDKTGRSAPKEPTEAMRLGTDLEDYVAGRFTEATGKKVRRRNAILRNDAFPFAHANIDREVVGEEAILECKTASRLSLKRFANGEFPQNYYVQVMHYLAVTGARKAYIAALVLQEGLHIYEVPRDEDEIAALMKAEADFWRYVERDEEPVVTAADGEALITAHPESHDGSVELFGRSGDLGRYLEIQEQIKALKKEADGISAVIKQDLGDCERGVGETYTATWKTETRRTFDREAFVKARPDVDLTPWMKESKTRVFRVKKNGGDRNDD